MKKTIQFLALIVISLILLPFLSVSSSADSNSDSDNLLAKYKSDLEKIEKYLNNINSLAANFTQTTHLGEQSEGMFYLQKPGKLRWEYYGPEPLIIVVSGKTVTHYDVELDEISYLRVENKLASFLTQENIRFDDKDIIINKINKSKDYIAITISDLENEYINNVTLQFSLKKLSIDSIITSDMAGNSSVVYFKSIEYDKPLDKKLFLLSKFR